MNNNNTMQIKPQFKMTNGPIQQQTNNYMNQTSQQQQSQNMLITNSPNRNNLNTKLRTLKRRPYFQRERAA